MLVDFKFFSIFLFSVIEGVSLHVFINDAPSNVSNF